MCHGISRVDVQHTWLLSSLTNGSDPDDSDTTEGLHYLGAAVPRTLVESRHSQSHDSDPCPRATRSRMCEPVARDVLFGVRPGAHVLRHPALVT
jgi:hypothetical protein